MSEIIYVLTVVYFFYVVEEVEGDNIATFINNVFKIDISRMRSFYINTRNHVLKLRS